MLALPDATGNHKLPRSSACCRSPEQHDRGTVRVLTRNRIPVNGWTSMRNAIAPPTERNLLNKGKELKAMR